MTLKNDNPRKKNSKVTIIDVARESGVSYSTVSRVLNGFEHVKDSTRERVLEAANTLGYVANLQARSLAGGKTNIIGILVPGLDNGYISEIVRGVNEESFAQSYNMMLYTTHRFQGKESTYAKSVVSGLSDGLLLVVPITQASYLDVLQEQNFPYVLVDQNDNTGKSHVVDSTNWQGAYDAVTYLIKLGHRKIVHLTGLPGLQSAVDRLAGYKAALQDHGIEVRNDYIVEGNFMQSQGYAKTQEIITMSDRPTALFAANDLSALGAIEAARDHGLSIPNDISIIGFDNISQGLITYPKLTTIHQSLAEMGRIAVQLLLEQINNPDYQPQRVTLPTHLVERESCRAI